MGGRSQGSQRSERKFAVVAVRNASLWSTVGIWPCTYGHLYVCLPSSLDDIDSKRLNAREV